MINILENGSTFLLAKRPLSYLELDNGHTYVPVVRHDLSIVEVANEDVAGLLMKQCGCCDAYFKCFVTASQEQVDLWKSPTD